MAWLRQHLRGQSDDAGPIERTDKILQFPDAPPRSPEDRGKETLDLVHRAAEVIRGIEDRARGLAEDAVEQLQRANARIQSLEAERRAAETRAHEAEEALKRAASRIAAAEEQLAQAERSARAAETRAIETEKALVRIEDAVRTRLLGQRRSGPGHHVTVA
jgi:chromosome segregation ATPase